MQKIQKQKLLGMLILVGMLTVILAISLPTLQMQPGEFFLPEYSNQPAQNSAPGFLDIGWVLLVIRGFQILLITYVTQQQVAARVLISAFVVLGKLPAKPKNIFERSTGSDSCYPHSAP